MSYSTQHQQHPFTSATTVIGAGSWGTALAIVTASKNIPTYLWGRNAQAMQSMRDTRCNSHYLPGVKFPAALMIEDVLVTCLEKSDLVLIAVPSHAFRSVLESIKPHISHVRGIVSASKGLDPATGKLQHEVVADIFPHLPFGLLSGPSFAEEVAIHLPTAVTIASTSKEFAAAVAERFHQKMFRVYYTADILGVQLGGAIKNVLAIAAGINDGLKFGANARAALITRGLAEMMRLGLALGAEAKTFMGLAGVGDLILTCSDDHSRNRRFGLALGQGQSVEAAKKSVNQTIEGIGTAKEIYKLAQAHQIEMPICESVYRVLHENITLKEALEKLLSRDAKAEY